ncbi:MAG: MBL fold metallo-hydrolase [Candidatus Cloacimonadales bacterium]|nr:MBL fold metallo-hydrolase [Candidatus Cloacimonadales bacterium]
MKIHFWGTRGSLPNSITEKHIKEKLYNAIRKSRQYSLKNDQEIKYFVDKELTFSENGTFGSNTACVEIKDDELNNRAPKEYLLCDAGAGLRDFGNSVLRDGLPGIFHIFMSHLHWDHIQGFPFFVPAFIPGNIVNIYGCHKDLEDAFIYQQNFRHFPLQWKDMMGTIKFHVLELGKEYEIAGYKINSIQQNHPGCSYGYSFQKNGGKIVYSTDSEHNEASESADYLFLDFFRNADLLVFDAQYILSQNMDMKKDWGHSSGIIGVELALKSDVKQIVLFHNEPTYDDKILEKMLHDTRRYAQITSEEKELEIELAYDGLEIEI